ncbi:hypothetical protein BKA66DRAFT_441097 [Pyrenochaeta sp. MPI-SDFR-AT-0127]|nr:hypothetical protein BKA66DRAFT_441097 [Pyrenochaeta sp. MPI-SDFR-AT-0127]
MAVILKTLWHGWSDPWPQYDALKTECETVLQNLATFNTRSAEFVVTESFKEHCLHPYDWFNLVHDKNELHDYECAVCNTAFDILRQANLNSTRECLWNADKFVPVELFCHHILCLPCFKSWLHSGIENKNKRPMCRSLSQPPNPKTALMQKFDEDSDRLYYDASITICTYAELLVKLVDTYLDELPNSLKDISGAQYSMQNGESLHSLRVAMFRAAIGNIRLARDRLPAFLRGDQDQCRNICKLELCSRAHLESVTFGVEVLDWASSYEELVRTECAAPPAWA